MTIPSSVTTIEGYAFGGCTSLTSVTIPNSVTEIDGGAFSGCWNLTSVILPNSLTSIWDSTFEECTSLTSMTIPNSVTSIADLAFQDCANLTSVCFQGNAPSLGGSSVFAGDSQLTVYHLAGATGWGGATFGGRPTALASPSIAAQPLNQTVAPGNAATFTVTAAGMPPFTYQWRKSGVKLAGATQPSFTIARAQTANAGAYSVAISNHYGSVISSNARLALDGIRPTVTILTPTSGQRMTNTSPVIITGKATDNLAVSNLWCQLNGTGWHQATPANGWTNWSAIVSPKAGTNTVLAYAEDRVGNRSLTNSRSFVFVTFSPLDLTVNGPGGVTPANLNGSLLEVGRSYTLTATPLAGCLFSNWIGSLAGLPSTSPILRFLMESNATLTANFVTNPFSPLKGSYYGLFSDPDRAQESSGFFTVALTAGGAYSGSLKCGANTYSIRGQFDLAGRTHQAVSRPKTNAWGLDLMLLFPDQVVGATISNGVSGGWVAGGLAYRAGFDARTNPATQYAGQYTLILPPEDSPEPQGCGCAAIAVTAGGLTTLTGSTADSTNFTQSVPVSLDGRLPVYASLYGGRGSIWGWLQFDANHPSASLEGDLYWFRPPLLSAQFYPAGVSNQVPAFGSRYTPPSSTTGRVVAMTNGFVIFESGDLPAPVTNHITLTVNNRIINLSSNKLTLNLTPSSGLFSGSVQFPGTTRSNSFKGALVQDRPAGFGSFLETNQAGLLLLGPED